MYPSQPGETSEYVTSEEPSSFVDGESPRVEYNHLVESTSTTGSLSSTNVPVASASLTSMAPPDTFNTPAASGGGAEAKLHSAVNDVGPLLDEIDDVHHDVVPLDHDCYDLCHVLFHQIFADALFHYNLLPLPMLR